MVLDTDTRAPAGTRGAGLPTPTAPMATTTFTEHTDKENDMTKPPNELPNEAVAAAITKMQERIASLIPADPGWRNVHDFAIYLRDADASLQQAWTLAKYGEE